MALYARIFTQILDSSINVLRVPTEYRWLWVTMLIICEEKRMDVVDMPVERLAARAGLTVEACQAGLEFLSSPDRESRSEAEEGRRIVPIRETGRGWRLVNWEYYLGIMRAEQEREATRLRVAAYRDREKQKRGGNGGVTESNPLTLSVSLPVTEEVCDAGAAQPTLAPDLESEFTAVERVDHKLENSGLNPPPEKQIVVAWVATYGEELILETLIDCSDQYVGKHWRYFEKILTNRRDNPNERPGNRRAKSSKPAAKRSRGKTYV